MGGAITQILSLSLYAGRDVIAQAQSGTGKTATFAVSILQKLDTSRAVCQALVLAPTRELAQQIQKVIPFDISSNSHTTRVHTHTPTHTHRSS